MTEPQFTVVTVTFNAEKTIQKTVESVLRQTHPPYEYLIIDGLSSDRTVELAKNYGEAFAQKGVRFSIVSEKDTGIYNAMNKGVKAAQGDFISFLNAGDWYQPDALEKISNFYREAPFDLTYGGIHYISPNGCSFTKWSRLDRFLITSRHWNHPSMFLKREIYQKYGFDEQYRAYADFELYLKLRKDGTKIRVIREIIASFVADGVSTNVKLKKILARSKEKYHAYRSNGYGRLYFLEAYGWELMKAAILKLRS